MSSVKIAGTGMSVPENIVTNFDLEKMVETSDEWIRTRTGVNERRIASKKIATSDLAASAAKEALKNAKKKASDVDLVLVATATPDMIFPSTACLVQSGIGAKNAAAFDISAVCSGFVYALSVAEQFIKAGQYKTIVVIGAEVISKYVDWTDRKTCVLFGDGAGAVVLTKDRRKNSLFSSYLKSDGKYAELLCIPAGGSRISIDQKVIEKKLHFIKMDGSKIFKVAVKNMKDAAKNVLLKNKMSLSDVDIVIPHQANIRIVKALADTLKISMERVFVNLDKYGNTSAASIPIALHEAVEQKRVKKGNVILMLAFGGGLTWGATLLRW